MTPFYRDLDKLALVTLGVAIVGVATPLLEQTRNIIMPEGVTTEFRQAVSEVAPSVVAIKLDGDKWCSGTIINPSIILSGAHCKINLTNKIIPYGQNDNSEIDIIGIAPAAKGDAVLIQTSKPLNIPIAKIATTEQRISESGAMAAMMGFPKLMILETPVPENRWFWINKENTLHAFPAFRDTNVKPQMSSKAEGSHPVTLESFSAPDIQDFIGRMSGGPAISPSGHIIGVISRASDDSDINEIRAIQRNPSLVNTTQHTVIKSWFDTREPKNLQPIVDITPIDTSKQFCIRKEGQENTTVTLEQLLTMQFTGNHRCS